VVGGLCLEVVDFSSFEWCMWVDLCVDGVVCVYVVIMFFVLFVVVVDVCIVLVLLGGVEMVWLDVG